VLCVPPRRWDRTPVRHHRPWPTAPAFQLRRPAGRHPLAGHGLGPGAGWWAPASGSGPADFPGAAASFRLSGWPVSLLRPSLPSGSPGLISGLQPGRSGSSARRAPSGRTSAAQQGVRALKRQLGSGRSPSWLDIHQRESVRLWRCTFTFRAHRGPVPISDHCIGRVTWWRCSTRKLRCPDLNHRPGWAAPRAHQPSKCFQQAGRCGLEQGQRAGGSGGHFPGRHLWDWRL